MKYFNSLIITLGLLTSLLLYAPLHAEEQNVSPEINKRLSQPDYDVWKARFERPGREVYDRRHEIMTALDLRTGMDVADIGAGTGLYTRLLAPAVGPQGKVYAVDPARIFIEEILRQAKSQGFENITGIINSQKDAGLAPASIDLAFVSATYHHFEYPQAMLQSIYQALRPDGQLIIIDFRKIAGQSSAWVISHSRPNKATVIKEIESENFKLTREHDFLKANFFLRFKKAPAE